MALSERAEIVGKHFICVETNAQLSGVSFLDWKWISGIVYAVTDRDFFDNQDTQVCY